MGTRFFAATAALLLLVGGNALARSFLTDVPKTKLAVSLDPTFFEEGGQETQLDGEEKEYFASSTQFMFFTDDGVGGQIIVNKPQEKYEKLTGEWVSSAAEVLMEDDELVASLVKREHGTFGTYQAEVLTLKIKDDDTVIQSTMLLIGGEKEIIILALANDADSADAVKDHAKIFESLTYMGKPLTDLKEVKKKD